MSRALTPAHALRPRPATACDGTDAATRRAGLGYAILRPLGAHEHLPRAALAVVANWSADHGATRCGITPDAGDLMGQGYVDRVGTAWGADTAARNADPYPGGRSGRPSYADVFREVWIDRRWTELCDGIRG